MSIAIIFKSNTYETNHKGEITEVIPPLLFQQLINLLFQFLILSLQKALLFQGFLFTVSSVSRETGELPQYRASRIS